MTHFLNSFLTEYDDTLSSDSYIDPVGTLIIWSAFGRQVFRNRINSISNDVRNFTINLFHHYMVKKLVEDDRVKLSPSLHRQYQSKDSLNFKQACLIFLENVFVFSMLRHEKIQDVETTGILGILNARRLWSNEDRPPALILTHEPVGQILIRQLGLGVSGRYKTPLMEMGFFDGNYHYHKPAYQSRWADAEKLINGEPKSSLSKLASKTYEFLKETVSRPIQGGKLPFSDVSADLTRAYARAFASPQAVGSYAKEFWLTQTELNQGAAGAIFHVLEETEDLSPQEAVERALAQDLAPAEKTKLEHIVHLEPFLADCSLLFTLMASRRTQSTGDVASAWANFGRDATQLPRVSSAVSEYADLPAIKGTEGAKRLRQLLRAAKANDLDGQIREMAIYHSSVMQSRGQVSWLNVGSDGTINVHARTVSMPEPNSRAPGSWHNSYYLPQFSSFVNGLRGAVV
ncbi:hypothetical protein C0V72_07210 [Porphyrobacter sp. TH134]|uniref:hypothetical protein n=1 Tax=Porphyrobacter sp. TH134 TaxID=2067450 RepID=UPI000C7C55FD|nr:hypothetical protein [Porphyrobacter sp. TH134]PLK23982.1 hypothetical protein C0V72_07210 [Porphyrobacter sp. TH134]